LNGTPLLRAPLSSVERRIDSCASAPRTDLPAGVTQAHDSWSVDSKGDPDMRGRVGLVVATGMMSALVLVVSLVTVSVAGPNVTRLAVIEHATTDTVVDLTTNGDSTGDLLTFHNQLFDEANNDVVGTDQGECVRIEVGVSWECRWINFLEGGSVTVEGPFFDAGDHGWHGCIPRSSGKHALGCAQRHRNRVRLHLPDPDGVVPRGRPAANRNPCR